MTRAVKGYSPTGEMKDYHDLVRMVQRIRINKRRPPALRTKMLHHGSELLKLFASDETMGLPDPVLEAREIRRERRSRKLDRAVEDMDRTAPRSTRQALETHERSEESAEHLNGAETGDA